MLHLPKKWAETRKIKNPYKARGKQPETPLQRLIVQGLNVSGLGYFFRIRNGATWNAARGQYLSNVTEKGIPDVHGFLKSGQAVYIEVKYIETLHKKKKLIFNVKISLEQIVWLLRAHRAGCRTGVAFCLEDAVAIAMADEKRYPRHPRTYCFLPEAEKKIYAERYKENKKALSELKEDRFRRDIELASKNDQEPWEKFNNGGG